MKWELNVPCPVCLAGIGMVCRSRSFRARDFYAHPTRVLVYRAVRGR